MSSRDVTIVETKSIEKCRYCLVGVPDVGLVGSIALSYTVQEGQMTEVGYIESNALPPVIVVHGGDPKPPIRLYRSGDVVVTVSEISIDYHLITPITHAIVDWVKSKGVELLISLSGMAVPNRLEIDVPDVYGVASSPAVKMRMRNAEIKILEEGFITGLPALLMKDCVKKNVSSMILLAQSHLTYPDPGAAASLITSLNKLLGLDVDTKELMAHEDELRVKLRALMHRTSEQMKQLKKGREQEIPLLYA
jgi:uncharacterized protein